MTTQTNDQAQVDEIVGRVVGDLGSTLSSALMRIGDRLGLYRALADHGPATAGELAAATGTVERYVRDWLVNQAAGGYVTYDAASDRFRLTPEQRATLADEDGPAFMLGGFQVALALARAEERIADAFRSGDGMPWGDHDAELFPGTERFFRPGYAANLVAQWIPSLTGVEERLRAGGRVADVGCGHGASTVLMAKAYPQSHFLGVDTHAPSIEAARRATEDAGVEDRVRFQIADASELPGDGYDLIAFFDCLHDLGDPVGALRRAGLALAPHGSIMLVEPMAGEDVEQNLTPVGRVFSACSVLVCTPNAVATGGRALGTLASESRLRAVASAAGLTRFHRAAETPVNRVFEVRP